MLFLKHKFLILQGTEDKQMNWPINPKQAQAIFIFPSSNETEPELLSWGTELTPEPAVYS